MEEVNLEMLSDESLHRWPTAQNQCSSDNSQPNQLNDRNIVSTSAAVTECGHQCEVSILRDEKHGVP